MVATAQPATVAKKGRAKKGEGPYTLYFIDSANKETTRIPNEVESIKLVDKANKSKVFNVKGLPPTVLIALAADGLKRRMDASVRNGIDDNASNSIELASAMYDNVKQGKLYTSKEGGGPGRQFDYDLWMDVLVRARKLRKEAPATDQQLQKARTKLEALTPKDRNEKVKNWKTKDAVFAVAYKEVSAERAKKNITKADVEGTNALDEMF